jgi:hypothetical protein
MAVGGAVEFATEITVTPPPSTAEAVVMLRV